MVRGRIIFDAEVRDAGGIDASNEPKGLGYGSRSKHSAIFNADLRQILADNWLPSSRRSLAPALAPDDSDGVLGKCTSSQDEPTGGVGEAVEVGHEHVGDFSGPGSLPGLVDGFRSQCF